MNITYGMNSEELWSIFKALEETLWLTSISLNISTMNCHISSHNSHVILMRNLDE